jgi:(S)-3,5-dihydroxyphenylglycine transaminase
MSFFYTGGGGGQAIRLSCSALTADQIDEGVRRLAALIADVRP